MMKGKNFEIKKEKTLTDLDWDSNDLFTTNLISVKSISSLGGGARRSYNNRGRLKTLKENWIPYL